MICVYLVCVCYTMGRAAWNKSYDDDDAYAKKQQHTTKAQNIIVQEISLGYL